MSGSVEPRERKYLGRCPGILYVVGKIFFFVIFVFFNHVKSTTTERTSSVKEKNYIFSGFLLSVKSDLCGEQSTLT